MAFQIQIHRTKSIETLNKNQKQNGSKKCNLTSRIIKKNIASQIKIMTKPAEKLNRFVPT